MCKTTYKVAHLRYTEKSRQCDLRFTLNLNDDRYGSLTEEIKSVRQVTDTVQSLLRHTKNKIYKIYGDLGWSMKIGEDIPIALLKNGMPVQDNVTCTQLFSYNKLKFKIFDETYTVVFNAPLVLSLQLPEVVYTNTMVKPLIKVILADRELSRTVWSVSKDKKEWNVVSMDNSYKPKRGDLGCYLKVCFIPANHENVKGEQAEAVSSSAIDTLPCLSLDYINYRHTFTKTKLVDDCFRIVTYNVLANCYTLDGQFSYCEPKYLNIDYRKQMLIHELVGYNAHLLCLQEVEQTLYHEYLRIHLKHCGFITSFHKKGEVKSEGLAIAFDKSRFKRIQFKHIVLAKELKQNLLFSNLLSALNRDKSLKDEFLRQHTSLQITALKCNYTGAIIVIASTHLYYHSEAGHLRLIQVLMSNMYISKFCKDLKNDSSKLTVIFCGDFNSLPESAVYSFMTDTGDLSQSRELLQTGININLLKNNYKFSSAYDKPTFTNYVKDFKGCLDYIFYEKDKLMLLQTVPLPNEEDVSSNVALPNKHFPSDHIALVADFKIGCLC